MITDHTHILTKWGDIVTARGFNDGDLIYVVPLYFLSDKGSRTYSGEKYEKYVDEFAERYRHFHPELVRSTPYGQRVAIREDQITRAFDPFANPRLIYDSFDKKIYRRVVDILTKFVPRESIGFIGSSLVGFQTAGSDLDIVIRGLENYRTLRGQFKDFLNALGACATITREQFYKSVVKYERLFNGVNNDFATMIKNRWPTIHMPGELFCKIRFTLNPANDVIFSAPSNLSLREGSVNGKVIEDEGVAFMPRHFRLRLNEGAEYETITYHWDYSYCVMVGDEVTVRGAIDESEKIIVVSDRKNHGITFKKQNNIACAIV
ncbi:MAG: hypothetical protein UY23_C0001G0376 [Candidatus Jorgensenbacteria bacterium GW2011_GWA1_48_11]|uniref:Polymerase nucleotidyl transferase domain-containing protein n=1 Tax=Candidatus Jorgensenbacteria bacterium GW2011_GWA1_48_11 TaxID=1618660 RepID=A0A0G1XBU0_9BACT|nr:MAG: hypothetical protein UY23_C0001G0376 [Candidatus Jorgensenbacteria bacterium GW2011_GWA1_48_11]KKW12261.1 MAG: hypothetical protein UY51_C0005G0503 [Candidatus Jorgensenbacteria bacterium GW2011_GWB1_49_9]